MKIEDVVAWLRHDPRFRQDNLDHRLLDCAHMISNWIENGTAQRDMDQAAANVAPPLEDTKVEPRIWKRPPPPKPV